MSKSTASLIIGIIALFASLWPGPMIMLVGGIIGLVAFIIGLVSVLKEEGKERYIGTAGLILGILALLLAFVIPPTTFGH